MLLRVIIVGIISFTLGQAKTHYDTQLVNHLFQDRQVMEFMPLDSDGPIGVTLEVGVVYPTRVKDKSDVYSLQVDIILRWVDIRMKWQPHQYNGLTYTAIPITRMWTPPLYCETSMGYGKGFNDFSNGRAVVMSDGRVIWRRSGRLTLYGNFDTIFFPRDSSYLDFRFTFWEMPETVMTLNFKQNSHQQNQVYFKNKKTGVDTLQWQMSQLSSGPTTLDGHKCLEVRFKIKRLALTVTNSLIVPLCMQMILVVATFMMVLKNPYRINLTVENLIDILFFINLSYNFIHVNQSNIISKFLNNCLQLCFITVILTLMSQWYERIYETLVMMRNKNEEQINQVKSDLQRNTNKVNTRIKSIKMKKQIEQGLQIAKDSSTSSKEQAFIRTIQNITAHKKEDESTMIMPKKTMLPPIKRENRRSFLYDTFDSNQDIFSQLDMSSRTQLRTKIFRTIDSKCQIEPVDGYNKIKNNIIKEESHNSSKSFQKLSSFLERQKTMSVRKKGLQLELEEEEEEEAVGENDHGLMSNKNIEEDKPINVSASRFFSLVQMKKNIVRFSKKVTHQLAQTLFREQQLKEILQERRFNILKYSLMNPYIIDLCIGWSMTIIGFMVILSQVWGNIENLWVNF